MAVRFNILNNSAARDKYIQGVKLLIRELVLDWRTADQAGLFRIS